MLPVVQRQPNRAAALGRTIVSRPGNACRYTEQAQRLWEAMQDKMGNCTCVAVNVRDDSARIPQMEWALRAKGRGNAGETADSFFHPSGPSGLGYLIQCKSLI
jgi:hypothetical protein